MPLVKSYGLRKLVQNDEELNGKQFILFRANTIKYQKKITLKAPLISAGSSTKLVRSQTV